MARPKSAAYCYPARDGSVPELERALPCLGEAIARRDVQIGGLQAWARDVSGSFVGPSVARSLARASGADTAPALGPVQGRTP